jgi:prepilin-type N-terminal cleavage/methylation domain-containing protein
VNARRRQAQHHDRGFTLVELLVTIVVASLIAATTFTFFAGQQQIYDTQTKMLGVQENLWASLETVTKYLRSAGAGIADCVRLDPDGSGADNGDPPPGGAAAPATGLRAYRNGVVFRIAPLWIQNGVGGAPDTITVAYGRGASGNFRDAYLGTTISAGGSTAAITTLPGQSSRFVPGEFMALVDEARSDGDRGCSLFNITDVVPGTSTLLHGTSSSWNPLADSTAHMPFLYQGGSSTATGGVRNLGQLVWIRLAIDASGAAGVPPRLTLDRLDDADPPQVLAEGIEDMQVAYGCDLGPEAMPDGVLTEGTDPATRLADEWTYNEPGDVEPQRCQRPDAVRITLVARTLTPEQGLANVPGNLRPAAEDGATGTADLFRHRVVNATVRMRN